jgi:ribokinase
MTSAFDVLVLGSANLDLVYTVERIPAPGETVLAGGQARHPGGKGLNQAVAAARAGARTGFVGALGDDDAAAVLRSVMDDAGIDTSLVRAVAQPTGTALITVQADGDNTIVVAAGANATVDHLQPAESAAITGSRVLVAQLEVPVDVVTEGAACARRAETTVVLNAAPARALDDELLRLVDVLVVNEHEARVLAAVGPAEGAQPDAPGDPADPAIAAATLLDRVGAVVVTLGAEGAVVLTGTADPHRLPAPSVPVVDTTGAGDTFTGVLAAGLAAGSPLPEAAARAVSAASLSTQTPGAVPSIPTAEQVDAQPAR